MAANILNGIDNLAQMDRLLKNQRIGLVTGGSAINKNMEMAVDVLHSRYRITTLFNLIYGIRGEFIYGEETPFYIDLKTQLPVYSIFNREILAPTPPMFENVDVLVFDIVEAGVRYYEYLACAGHIMKACAAHHIPFVVLDRVAPINGVQVEGTLCPPTMHTIVGDYGLPNRIGLTMGEFCSYINQTFSMGCPLHVVPLLGWKRHLYQDETQLPWVLPSPSLPHVTANILYAGMCIFEGVSSISEGRGTSKPFELIGAPWMDGDLVAQKMNNRKLAGVHFGGAYFRPTSSKFAKEVCYGVQIYIKDRYAFESVRTALTLLEEIMSLYPGQVKWADCSAGHDVKTESSAPNFVRYTDKLLATDLFTTGKMNAQQLLDHYNEDLKKYIKAKEEHHLYA